MTINYVDVGLIANDGTGDDLREAMIKINNNFEDLDARLIEETVIVNAGSFGTGLYSGFVNNEHRIKRLVAGQNISISSDNDIVTINSTEGLEELVVISDNGSITVQNGQTLSIQGGEAIETRTSGQTLYIDLDTTGIVARDTAPRLEANLTANNKNISGAGTISAEYFQGHLQGLVWGYDLRTFGSYFQGFDFGNFRRVYNNAIEFILTNTDVDLGGFSQVDSGPIIELGPINPAGAV